MQIKYLTLVLFSLQTFATSAQEDCEKLSDSVITSSQKSLHNEDLQSICETLVEKLGVSRAKPVTPEELQELGVPTNQTLETFFLTCNTVLWRHMNFVFVKNKALWKKIVKEDLLNKSLFPIAHISDSAGYVCYNFDTGYMEDYFPEGSCLCGSCPHDIRTPESAQKEPQEDLAGYLRRYFTRIEPSLQLL